MSWNYRIKKTTITHSSGETEDVYALHECYYNDKGICNAYTERAVSTSGESVEELIAILERQLNDAKKGIVFTEDTYKELKIIKGEPSKADLLEELSQKCVELLNSLSLRGVNFTEIPAVFNPSNIQKLLIDLDLEEELGCMYIA